MFIYYLVVFLVWQFSTLNALLGIKHTISSTAILLIALLYDYADFA